MQVPYFEPNISQADKTLVLKALNQRWLTNGKFLKKFEKRFFQYIKSKYASGVGSATQALHLSLKALDVKTGDEVIVPTFTFTASANAVTYCGAEPVLTDVDPNTFNITPNEIKKKINKKTKGIIVVHYGGQSCDMDEILKIAKENNLFVIEDCAHALGSKYKKKNCGNIGNAGCFSFYPTKIITTGEGGMVTTNNNSINKKINLLRSQGMSISAHERESSAQWKYDVIDLGYNYRLDEIRSALGYSQLNRVNEFNKKRILIGKKYNQKLKRINGISIPEISSDRNHIYHLYTIKIEKDYHLNRNELFTYLQQKNIGTSVQYTPLHLMSIYKSKYKKSNDEFTNANLLKDKVLCLPIFPSMTTKQVDFVISKLT